MSQDNHDDSNTGQLRLQFPENPLIFEDMCISSSNENAISIIKAYHDWPTCCLCLIGPKGSGLTTAILAWAAETTAKAFQPDAFDTLSHADIEVMAPGCVAIDRADLVSNESNLLYLFNRTQALGGYVLLTAARSPSAWAPINADLQSRLLAMPIAELFEPDETLLKARLTAASRRRYVKLPDSVADYLAARMEHSYAAIEDLVTRLDTAMEADGRKLTIPLARQIMALKDDRRPDDDIDDIE